jgi:dolichol-phosphate mannosyltransferase
MKFGSMNVQLSVVVPAYNEAGNIAQLTHEVAAALAGYAFELIIVDDGSSDSTAAETLRLRSLVPELRLLRHPERRGQSAALISGVRTARAPWIVTLDGDCQNDPRDIANLLAARDEARDDAVQLVMGRRVNRRDTPWRRIQSRVANAVRSWLLGDGTPDTGCGIKLFLRETFLVLPPFDHMHRFLPALFQREGARVISVPVNHRPRTAGRSKYGMLDRLGAGLMDLVGVMWLIHRRCNSTVRELTEPALPATPPVATTYSSTTLPAQDTPR